MSAPPILAADEVSVRFGGTAALERVSVAVHAGAVTCLLGDNGAGKSTLIAVLSGALHPTGGCVRVDGRPVRLDSPRDARDAGVATVFQSLAVAPLMSVWRNFVLGAEPLTGAGPLRRLDDAAARRAARLEMERMGIAVDPERLVGTLSGGERQALAIARALHAGARAVILDEPTAALGVRQSRLVLDNVARVRERGAGVLLVTHNPQHAHAVGDRFVVLRRGRVVADLGREETGPDALMRLMGGEPAVGD